MYTSRLYYNDELFRLRPALKNRVLVDTHNSANCSVSDLELLSLNLNNQDGLR